MSSKRKHQQLTGSIDHLNANFAIGRNPIFVPVEKTFVYSTLIPRIVRRVRNVPNDRFPVALVEPLIAAHQRYGIIAFFTTVPGNWLLFARDFSHYSVISVQVDEHAWKAAIQLINERRRHLVSHF